jgi:hypothetical protein
MYRLSHAAVQELLTFQGPWGVSLFMSTHRAGAETRQDPIRYRNLLRLAEHAMAQRGIAAGERTASLVAAQKLIAKSEFWQHQSDGLAAFIAPGVFRYYTVPSHFAENAVVDSAFHVKPLLPVYYGDGRFYLLSLSQKRVRVFQCTRDEHEELQVLGVPTSIEQYMQFFEPSGTQSNRVRGRASPVAVRSSGERESKQRVLEFFRQVDGGLHDLLKDEQVPLLVACVESLFPLYREANTYAHLAPLPLSGNPEATGTTELHQRAWAQLAPHFNDKQEAAVRRFAEVDGSRKASSKIRTIVPAAIDGRVETLLVAADQEAWGVYDPATGQARESKVPPTAAQELLNLATVQTLRHQGAVYVLPSAAMPHGAPAVAILRY